MDINISRLFYRLQIYCLELNLPEASLPWDLLAQTVHFYDSSCYACLFAQAGTYLNQTAELTSI